MLAIIKKSAIFKSLSKSEIAKDKAISKNIEEYNTALMILVYVL